MAKSSSTSSISSEFWHHNLVDIPSFTNAFIEKMASENLPVKVSLTRGYKFSHESYIHDVEVKRANEEEGITVRGKCFRSMKKNEEPHRLFVAFKRQNEVGLELFACSCAAGQGLCHHVIGLMFTLAHYQMLGLKSVPPVVSKTSKPQTWYIPSRTDGVSSRLRCSPLIVIASCLDDKQKKTLKSNIHKLGGHVLNDWRQNTVSHLVMDGLTFTIKVIHALAECTPIVMPSYFDDVVETSSSLPPVERYLPLLKEETISSQDVSFLPNETRKTLFHGRTFIFLSKKQYKRVHHAVESSGGCTLLRDAPGSETDDCLVTPGVCVMMVDIKEQNSLPPASQQWILHIVETLKSHKCRPIPESELGLALLFVSLDKYCNPSINAVPPLTQNLVSQSFQAADIMSQRACSQQLTVQLKKPSIPVRHCKDDRRQGTYEQGLASSNIYKSMNTAYVGKRCNSTDSVADESIPDNQSVSSAKKRKIMDIETAETTLVTESMDESNPEITIQGHLILELADSIVADSLETKHDSSSNCDLEPLECKKQLMSIVENVADSQDVNENSAMVMDKAYGCQGKEEKADEQNRLSSLLVRHACGASQRDTPLTDQDNGYERQVSQSLHSATPSDHQDATEPSNDLHVPQGFLCSKIPRKVSRKCLYEDEDAHLPSNLVVVDHMSLVVRTVTSTPMLEKTSHSNTTKNFKKFKKQTYPGSCIGLPRIIGGSDLAIYQCAERLDKDEWFLEAREADVERQREERLAEELFRWEERPTKTRRLKR